MSECPKGGRHVPEMPATIKDGWIIHYCRKCRTVLSKYPQRRKVAFVRRLLADVVLVAVFTVASVLTALTAVLMYAPPAQAVPAASAAPVAHRASCASRSVCFWDNAYETGTKWVIDVAGCVPCRGAWYSIPGKGSIDNNTNSSVEVWSDLEHKGHCVYPQNIENLNNEYGYFYIKYGSANCTGIPNHN
jgi:hypothetical protein